MEDTCRGLNQDEIIVALAMSQPVREDLTYVESFLINLDLAFFESFLFHLVTMYLIFNSVFFFF